MTLFERVKQALEKARPALQADGGDVELVDVTQDGEVSIRLLGHCKGCPLAQMTVSHHIERILRDSVPEIVGVAAVD